MMRMLWKNCSATCEHLELKGFPLDPSSVSSLMSDWEPSWKMRLLCSGAAVPVVAMT